MVEPPIVDGLDFIVMRGSMADALSLQIRSATAAPRRASSASRRYNRRWRNTRAVYLSANAACVLCGAPATDVDHVTPHGMDHDLFWDTNNWQSLCHSCHSKKTQLERGLTAPDKAPPEAA